MSNINIPGQNLSRRNNGMYKKRWFQILMVLAALFLIDAAGTALVLRMYPQAVIEMDALFGEMNENLKEFEIDDEGMLTAVSDDPWISYAFGTPWNVRHIEVFVSHVEGPETEAQFYLLPSLGYRAARLSSGNISAAFSRAQGRKGVTGIRFDLAAAEGTSLSVERVVINGRKAVALECQRMMAAAVGLALLLMAEAFGWYRLFSDRKSRRYGTVSVALGALVQTALKASLLWALRGYLIDNDGSGHQFLLCWMMVLGVEVFCILALHLGAGAHRKNIWWCHILLVPFAFVQFAAAEFLGMTTFDFQTPAYLALNLLECALVAAVLLVLIRQGAAAFSLTALICMALFIGNHYYGMLRGNPIQYFDLAQAGTAAKVIGNYTLALDVQVAAAVLETAILTVSAFTAFGGKSCGWKPRTVAVNLAAVAAVGALVYVWIPTVGNFSNLQIISREKGYLLSFTSFIKMGRIKRPEGYTAQAAGEALAPFGSAEAGRGNTPNIIVIMDEAFADLPGLYGFETDVDVIPNIHSMTENTIHGRVLASVYGGGTANTEYEFLTGNSLYFFPIGSSPYVQYTGSRQQSLAWKLGEMGYSHMGYHPYLAISYRRTAAYPFLGLDPFYSIDDELPYEDCLRSYVSDRSDFKNVIHLYEEREPGQPFFIFNVTMQNHGGYSSEEPDVEVTVKPEDETLQKASLLEYLALIHETDAAFGELVDYFSRVEEDTIILMFGDHQPSMEADIADTMERYLKEKNGTVDLNGMADSQGRYYSTFVMWANFDIEEKTDVVTSPNYLRPMLLEQAGVKLNAYEAFLLELSREYPAMNAYGFLDHKGEWHSREESAEGMLGQYQYLIYNNVFDKKNLTAGYE